MGHKRHFQSTILFNPEELVGPDKQFFYFKSLYDYQNRNYHGVTAVIQSGYNNFKIDRQEGLEWDSKLETILQLLQEFENHEAANERILFEQAIKPLMEYDPDKFKEFEDIYTDTSINYPKFLTLLYILDKDTQTAKELTDDMIDVTTEFNTQLKEALKIIAEQNNNVIQDDYAYLKSHRNEATTLARAQMQGARYTKIAQNLINTYYNLKMIEEDQLNSSGVPDAFPTNLDSLIFTIIRSAITEGESFDRTCSAMESAKYFQTQPMHLAILDEIRQQVIELDNSEIALNSYIEQLTYNIYNNEIKPGTKEDKLIKLLLQKLKTLRQNAELINQKYEEVHKIIYGKNALEVKYGRIVGLTKNKRFNLINTITDAEDRAKLLAFETGEKYGTNAAGRNNFDIRKVEHYNEYMKTLASILHKQVGKQPLFNEITKRIQISDKALRKRILTVSSETNAAMFQANIVSNLEAAWTSRTGASGIKTDVRTVLHFTPSGVPKTDLDKILPVLEDRAHNVDTILSNAIREYNSKDVQNGKRDLSYSVLGDTLAEATLDNTTIRALEQTISDKQKIVEILSNTFELDNSVKFGETYNEIEHGFHGGSLGPNLERQVENLNTMLELGGITPPDQKFLINAIMNAGPGMIGDDQKDRLELYLSSIAAMCMFNSGGQSLQSWYQSTNNQLSKLSTNKIHLFTFNTYYVPLSYVLHLTRIGIEKCINNLQEFRDKGLAGNQVVIYNPVNEAADKKTRKIELGENEIADIGDWPATAAMGLPKVNLDMVLLGGFLDVIKSISSILGEILQ